MRLTGLPELDTNTKRSRRMQAQILPLRPREHLPLRAWHAGQDIGRRRLRLIVCVAGYGGPVITLRERRAPPTESENAWRVWPSMDVGKTVWRDARKRSQEFRGFGDQR